jgi:hypothetical protein
MLLSYGTVFLICSVELYLNPVKITVSRPIAGNTVYIMSYVLYLTVCLMFNCLGKCKVNLFDERFWRAETSDRIRVRNKLADLY